MIKKVHTDDFQQWSFIRSPKQTKDWISSEHLFVTLDGKAEIKETILSGIRASKSCIKICSFILTDEDVINELFKKLDSSDVAIFILTQLDGSKFSSSFLTEEEMNELFKSSAQTHLNAIGNLYDKGAHVRASESLHAKFYIFDNETTLLTSANLTNPSLNLNPESGVILTGKTSLDAIKVYDIIYRYGTSYNNFIKAGGNKRFITKRISNFNANWFPDSSNGFLFTLEEKNRTIYDKIIQIIDDAKKQITLSSYCIVGIENLNEFMNSLTTALNRGVKVNIFCRGMNYRYDHLYSCQLLAKLGCNIYGDLYNHSKGLSNEKESIIFTANIDGRHGLLNGFEVGAVLTKQQSKSLNDFMDWQIKNAPYYFTKNPVREDVFNSYIWYCNSKGIKPPKRFNALVLYTHGLSEEEKKSIENNIFYGVYKDGQLIALEINGNYLKAEDLGDNRLKVKPTKSKNEDFFRLNKYLIMYNELILKHE